MRRAAMLRRMRWCIRPAKHLFESTIRPRRDMYVGDSDSGSGTTTLMGTWQRFDCGTWCTEHRVLRLASHEHVVV
jgi:hypothetical protein